MKKAVYGRRKERFAVTIPKEIRSQSIPEFCAAEGIGENTYYKMRAAGFGPRESRFLNVVRITPEAHLEWQHRMQSAKHHRANKIKEARSLLAKRANKASVSARKQRRAIPAE